MRQFLIYSRENCLGKNRFKNMYDVMIIGAGIIGTMLVWKLAEYDLKTVVLEKENDIAEKATMANSAIVHTGYDPQDGTLKAELNVKGAAQYRKICERLHCAYREVGAYVAACGDEEEEKLAELEKRAAARDIPYRILSGDEAREKEPNLADGVTKVLDFYTTAVIYPWEVADACMGTAMENGAELFLNTPCEKIERNGESFVIYSGERRFEARFIVNAAGVHAEEIHRMVAEPGWHSTPKRGEYYVLDQDVKLVDHIIFPVPSEKYGKGVLAVPTVYGNTLIGPDSEMISDGENNENTTEGLSYVRKNIEKTLKNVPLSRSIRTFAGVRPATDRQDFIIEELRDVPHFIDAASIESPGLASAPAIADRVIGILSESGLMLERKKTETLKDRKVQVVLAHLSEEEKNALIRENPAYGRIICRCEQISEGEIVDCIHQNPGAHTIKGVKKRVRPGMGRCQGGFCEPRVAQILARELGIPLEEVVLDSPESFILEGNNRI